MKSLNYRALPCAIRSKQEGDWLEVDLNLILDAFEVFNGNGSDAHVEFL